MRIFFFKHKTAYEMAQCDWSSDVCSSYLMIRHTRWLNVTGVQTCALPILLEAGPESSVTMPTRSSLGAPAALGAGVWAAAGGDRTAISAITLSRGVFIMPAPLVVGCRPGTREG